MTWAEFKTAVTGFLTTEGTRLGVASLRLGLIHAGARDLQQFVRRYQEGNTTTLAAADFTTEGAASLGEFPTRGVKLNGCFVKRTIDGDTDDPPNIRRFPILFDWPWERRYELVAEDVAIPDQNSIGCIDPYLKTFYIYPAIEASFDEDGTTCTDAVELHWDGVQWDTFEDLDVVSFDEPAALAVSYYVKVHLVKETEPGMSDDYMKTYMLHRLNLFLN